MRERSLRNNPVVEAVIHMVEGIIAIPLLAPPSEVK